MSFLIDSNVLIDMYRSQSRIMATLNLISGEKPFITTLNYAEVLSGLINRPEYERIDTDLLTAFGMVTLSITSSQLYAHVKHSLRSKGTPIPEIDMLIASIALEHGLTLVTKDKHFAAIEGLKTMILK